MRSLAFLLELVVWPGLGHLVLGHRRTATAWLGATVAVALLLLVSVWFVPVALALRLASAIHAWRSPYRTPSSRGQRLFEVVTGVIVASLFLVPLRLFVVQGWRIPASSGAPTLQIGDHVLVNKLAYRLGAPARGDLAVFVHPCEPDRDYVKRIVAVGGDTVEIRCDLLYVNGEAIEVELQPGDCSYRDQPMPGEWVEERCTAVRETLGGHAYVTYQPAAGRAFERDGGGEGEHDFPTGQLPGCMDRAPQAAGRLEPVARLGGRCAPRERYVVPAGHVFTLGDNRANSSDSRSWGPVPIDHLHGRVIGIWVSSDRAGLRFDRFGPVE